MRFFRATGILYSFFSLAQAQKLAPDLPSSATRVRLNPTNVRDTGDTDYTTWTIPGEKTVSKTINEVDYTIAAGGDSTISGSYYKYQYTRFLSSLGERVVNEGITTSEQAGLPLTLTIKGLSPGNHTLLAWHNAWDKLDSVAPINITVDGETVAENLAQSIRVDNIWEAASSYLTLNVESNNQTIEVVYTPSSGNDTRAYLNGFEVDTPDIADRISFPTPHHRDERIQFQDGAKDYTATWRAPKSAEFIKYNIYLGTSNGQLKSVGLEQLGENIIFKDLNKFDTYYWRVDVVRGGQVYIGNVFMFRLAQLAFPGAEGHGRWARGGRGGKVVHVTTLEDNTEPGSLRYALAVEAGPRTIVFDVGGVITTTSRLTVNGQYITLAGQTAPGKGIVVQGWPLGLSGATDNIFRHVRVRPGTITGQTIDGMGMQGSNHCIFDRCSMGWAIDECFSSRSAYNITFQRNMISEPLNDAGHKNYPAGTQHGYAATIGGDVGSFHHNLIAHAEGRSWSMGGGVDDTGSFAGRLDLRNNVVYNFGGRVTDGGAHEVNFVSNYYKQGPASSLTYDLRAQYEDGLPGEQQYFCDGNSMYNKTGGAIFGQDSVQHSDEDGTSIKKNIACYADVTINPPPSYQKFYETPFFDSFVDTQSSTEAYKRVVSDSGAQQPAKDDHDKRIVNETFHGTYTYVGSKTGKLGIIDNPDDVGGLEDFPTTVRDSSWDADGDGIADWWDGSTGGDGYTPLEGFLNFMAEPHVYVDPGATATIDLALLARGFVPPLKFTIKHGKTAKGSVSVRGDKATYKAGKKAGVEYLKVSLTDAEGSKWSRPYGVAVFQGASKAQ